MCRLCNRYGAGGRTKGGMIIAAGTPEEIAQTKSPTAAYIAEELDESERLKKRQEHI